MGHSIFVCTPYGRHPCLRKNYMELPTDDTNAENKNPWKNLWMASMMLFLFSMEKAMDGICDMIFFLEIQPYLWMTLVLWSFLQGNTQGWHVCYFHGIHCPFSDNSGWNHSVCHKGHRQKNGMAQIEHPPGSLEVTLWIRESRAIITWSIIIL